MRGHPDEALAHLDRAENTDFRRISVDKIWTPDLQIGGQIFEERIQDAEIDFEFGAVFFSRIFRARGFCIHIY